MMENAEEVFQCLEDFTKRRPKVIPRELEEYLHFVARTGDPVYQWALVKNLFKEKLLNVITEFFETSPGLDIPQCPNVDLFNYETMKNTLLEKIDAFSSAPFTVQRICELLTSPRKQYNRIDKFMRAFEKNILVVSTRDPGTLRRSESENGEGPEGMVNGSDSNSNSDYNVDVEMEDMTSWKENADPLQTYGTQPSSSESNQSTDSPNSSFISQNGPSQDPAVSDVELMTIEPDTNLTPLDLPEQPSPTGVALLPSSNEETKNNNERLPRAVDEDSPSSITDPSPVVTQEPEPQKAEESSIETDGSEIDTKLENVPDSKDSNNPIDAVEKSLLKDDSDEMSESGSSELCEEDSSNIKSNAEMDSNVDMVSVILPRDVADGKEMEVMNAQETEQFKVSSDPAQSSHTSPSSNMEDSKVEPLEIEKSNSESDPTTDEDSLSPVVQEDSDSAENKDLPHEKLLPAESMMDTGVESKLLVADASRVDSQRSLDAEDDPVNKSEVILETSITSSSVDPVTTEDIEPKPSHETVANLAPSNLAVLSEPTSPSGVDSEAPEEDP